MQLDGEIAEFSNKLALQHSELYEFHYKLEKALGFLEASALGSYGEMRDLYDPQHSPNRDHANDIQRKLLDCISTTLRWCDAEFNYSLKKTVTGIVLSVVVGSKSAMAKAREAGLLSISVPQVAAA